MTAQACEPAEWEGHTPGPWERVGASKVWKTGAVGGAVAIMAEPDCSTSRDFRPVTISSKRWHEAMANAALIAAAPALAAEVPPPPRPRRRVDGSAEVR